MQSNLLETRKLLKEREDIYLKINALEYRARFLEEELIKSKIKFIGPVSNRPSDFEWCCMACGRKFVELSRSFCLDFHLKFE